MRIVVVDAGLPDRTRSAGERAAVDQLDALVALGHAATVVALGHAPGGSGPEAAIAAELAGRGVTVHPGIGPAALMTALAGADAVVVHRPGPAVRVAPVLADRPGFPVVYAGHDLHAARIDAGTALLGGDPRRSRVVTVAERAAWARADVVTYPTEGEATTVREQTGHPRVVAVPYYRLTATDLASPSPGVRRGVLMVGGADHDPNRDAVSYTVTDLLPRLRAAGVDDPVTVVGDWPPAARAGLEPAVTFTGRIAETTLRELHASHRLLLAPLRFGAGAKRKLVAAMWLGLPVVTTSAGAAGLLVRDAGAADGVRVGDDAEALTRAVVALGRPGAGDAQSARAQRAVAEVYSTVAYDQAVTDVMAAAVSRSGRSG